MKKGLYAIAAVLAFLVLILVTLLFSHTGNVFIWNQMAQRIDALNGELVDGQLLSGWTIENLSWQDELISFNSERVHLSWQLSAILDKKLPIELIEVEQSKLQLSSSSDAEPPPEPELSPAQTKPLDIPLDITIARINIRNFEFVSPAAAVSLGSLSTDADLLNNQLLLKQTRINKLQVLIPDSNNTQTETTPASETKEPISLPEVRLPLPIELRDLQLTDGSYQQSSVSEKVSHINLSFNWQETLIEQLNLSIEHDMASANLNGQINLTANYPLKADITADLHKPLLNGMLTGENLSLNASGDLTQLQLNLQGKGPVTAQITGSVAPIVPDFPFDLNLNWQTLSWPLTDEPKLVSTQDGKLSLAGSLKGYTIKLNSGIEVPGQPLTDIKLSGNGDLDQLAIKQLLLKEPDGHLELQGQLGWKDKIQWQGKTTLVNLNPGLWVPSLPGKLNGTIDSDFKLANNQWQVDIPTLSIKGKLRDFPVNVSGKLAAKQADNSVIPVALTIDHLSAAIGQNKLTANGKLADQWNMTAKLDAQSLTQLYPDLQGKVQGDFEIKGNAKAPTVHYQLSSPQILFQQLNLSGLQAQGNISSDKQISGKTQITLSELVTGELLLNNLNLQASGNEQQHQLAISVEGKPVSGAINLTGSWKNQQWQGQLSKADINTPLDTWSLQQPLSIAVDKTLNARLSDQCWVSNETRLCIEPTQLSAKKGQARFKLAQFDFKRLASYFPENFNWQSVLSAQGQVQWLDKQPTASLQLKTTPGTLSAGELAFDYNHLELLLNFRNQRLSSSLLFQSNQLGIAKVEVAVDDIQKERKLSGNLALAKLRLDFLTPFIPEVSAIDGTISAQTRLDGTLAKPLLYGDLILDQGLLSTRTEMVSITELTTRLKIQGDKGVIDGHMMVGEGRLDVGGDLNWQQMPPSGHISLKGNEVQFQYPGLLEVKVSPDLKFSLGSTMALTGKVVIPWARIEVKDLPKSAIKVSDDAVVIVNGEPEEDDDRAPFNMKVDVILGDDIKVDAYGLETNLGGHLLLVQESGKSLEGNGSIQLIEGRYRYVGQDLLIQEGNIIFSGPIKTPYLMIDAIRNPDTVVDDTEVGIKVNGTVSQPNWEVYSVPAMSQQEQLSYLLRGRGLDSGDDSALQSILLNVGISQFGGVVSTVGEAIGFSDVTLDTEGSGGDTQVTIGGNIAPGLRLSYGAGVFSSIAEIKVRYELMPRLYLQAVSGLAQAVDLFYQFKIDSGKN